MRISNSNDGNIDKDNYADRDGDTYNYDTLNMVLIQYNKKLTPSKNESCPTPQTSGHPLPPVNDVPKRHSGPKMNKSPKSETEIPISDLEP